MSNFLGCFCVWQQLLWTKVHPLIFSAKTCSQRADRKWKRFGCQPTPIVSSKISMYCDTDLRDNFLFNSLALHVLDCLPQMSGLGEKNWKWNFRIFKKVMFLKQFLMNVTFGDIKEANDNNALATIPSHEWSSHAPLIVSHFTDIIVKKFTWTMLLFVVTNDEIYTKGNIACKNCVLIISR